MCPPTTTLEQLHQAATESVSVCVQLAAHQQGHASSVLLRLWGACVQDILLMVGPYGDWIKHNLEDRTILVSECDGVRLISAEKHELLSRVPDSLVDIFKIGSTAPGNVCTLCCLPCLFACLGRDGCLFVLDPACDMLVAFENSRVSLS